ncbi:zinc knuckle-domain-containing protein [Cladochytrium replicatum]|nr:zinc knuckle-domain-containing protein [Cladochytrium replicatum]
MHVHIKMPLPLVDSIGDIKLAVRLANGEIKVGAKVSTTGVTSYKSGKAQSTTQCQKCYAMDHWTYQCKNDRVYLTRPSRTRQLSKPSSNSERLQSPIQRGESVIERLNARRGLAEQILMAKELAQNRKRDGGAASSSSSGSSSSSESESDSDDSSSSSSGNSSSGSSSSSDSEDEDAPPKKR